VRVLHVITGLGLGGAEGQLTALLARAPRAGTEPAVASLLPGGENREALARAGVSVTDLGMARGVPDPRAVARLVTAIKAMRPHVLQSWMYHADLVATAAHAILGKAVRPRLVWGVRCSDMDTARYGLALRVVIALSARLSGRPDAVVVNSQTGRAVHEGLGYRPKRFVFIPNGIDTERFRPDPAARRAMRGELGVAEDAVVAIHVARHDPMKDHETFLAALAANPGVTGIAVGLGTESLPARPNLMALGARRDVPRLLGAADIFVSSSAFGEGFSNAVAEAMATGLPAIATDVGDARFILGGTGAIVPPRDARALAQALSELAALGAAERQARGAAARARIVAEFPLARAAERFAALYRAIL
jgi:glycosyltransferase involved in cell wall biosynthesis